MKLILVGLPGSGKSTFGRKLADHLGYKFIDLDDVIVDQSGISITEIFKQFGEDYFRTKEQVALLTTLQTEDKLVLATGGGTPCYFDNMMEMNAVAKTIYLNVPVDIIATRIANNPDRPLMQGQKVEEKLKELLSKREHFYGMAAIQLDGSISNIEKIILELELKLKGYS